ncbi:MAG: dipeptidase [Bacteroidia bacterium]
MYKTTLLFILVAIAGFGYAQESYEPFLEKAESIARSSLIVDTHIDVPIRLWQQRNRNTGPDDVSDRTEGGDFDYVRCIEGGLNAPFMSIYIPAIYQRVGGAKRFADGLIDMVDSLAAAHPQLYRVAKRTKHVEKAFQKGIIALPMGMENGAGIEGDLKLLKYFYKRGIRYITLTHSEDNRICDSSYDTTGTWNGLSTFGRKVVPEMNRLGIMIDISHVSDSAFYQVLALTQKPVIASHSSCRKYIPDFERNMNDDMIKKLGDNGGVIQINFGSTFVDSASRNGFDRRRAAIRQFLLESEAEWGDSTCNAFIADYDQKQGGLPFSNVQRVADHIDHVVKLAGVDHVGFGSDFDGVGDSLPIGLKDVSMYPNLIAELLRRGYSTEDIRKFCGENIMRVWKANE